MTTDAGAHALEREFDLVESAVELVATRRAQRVVVGGIRFGAQLAPAAAELAGAYGVRVVPMWTSDDGPADLLVERVPDAEGTTGNA